MNILYYILENTQMKDKIIFNNDNNIRKRKNKRKLWNKGGK